MENEELRKAGLKVTLPRIKIFQILEQSEVKHLSAESIYKALLKSGNDVGLATVYRVLTQFEAAGLVTRPFFEGGHSIFELVRDDRHDHIVCVKCGLVAEFNDPIIEHRQNEIVKQQGFTMTDRVLNIYGLCGQCQ